MILTSDKTKLSQFRGDKTAWPIYLTIGNLSKKIRRSSSLHGTILVGYLPVRKFNNLSNAAKPLARYQAFHSCVRIILDSIVEAGSKGTYMTCADRQVRHIFPILACYAVDYPEQCLVVGCMENRCPICEVAPDQRGSYQHQPVCSKSETLNLVDAHRSGSLTPELRARFDALGLRAIHEPFWRDLPHSDIFELFTPDLLHQLHKGVFKDHLVKWCTNLLSTAELDKHFRSSPAFHSPRHFKESPVYPNGQATSTKRWKRFTWASLPEVSTRKSSFLSAR